MAQTVAELAIIPRCTASVRVSRKLLAAPWGRERRDAGSREQLRSRVRSEFQEMPGLTLTLMQAARLFGIRADICRRVLGELAIEGLLFLAPGEQYSRRSPSS